MVKVHYGAIVRWNLKIAYSKVTPLGTRITSGTTGGMRPLNKSKSKDYADTKVQMQLGHGLKVIDLTTGGLTDV